MRTLAAWAEKRRCRRSSSCRPSPSWSWNSACWLSSAGRPQGSHAARVAGTACSARVRRPHAARRHLVGATLCRLHVPDKRGERDALIAATALSAWHGGGHARTWRTSSPRVAIVNPGSRAARRRIASALYQHHISARFRPHPRRCQAGLFRDFPHGNLVPAQGMARTMRLIMPGDRHPRRRDAKTYRTSLTPCRKPAHRFAPASRRQCPAMACIATVARRRCRWPCRMPRRRACHGAGPADWVQRAAGVLGRKRDGPAFRGQRFLRLIAWPEGAHTMPPIALTPAPARRRLPGASTVRPVPDVRARAADPAGSGSGR